MKKAVLPDTSGATAVEYALIACAIAATVATAIYLVSDGLTYRLAGGLSDVEASRLGARFAAQPGGNGDVRLAAAAPGEERGAADADLPRFFLRADRSLVLTDAEFLTRTDMRSLDGVQPALVSVRPSSDDSVVTVTLIEGRVIMMPFRPGVAMFRFVVADNVGIVARTAVVTVSP